MKKLLIVAAFCVLAAPTAAVAGNGHGLCHFKPNWHWMDWLPCY
jgi:hypothetical protein